MRCPRHNVHIDVRGLLGKQCYLHGSAVSSGVVVGWRETEYRVSWFTRYRVLYAICLDARGMLQAHNTDTCTFKDATR